MGGTESKLDETHLLGKSQVDIVNLMMPVYYNPEPITDAELALAVDTWNAILTNTSTAFTERLKDTTFTHATGIKYFYHTFYERLFDVHPSAKEMFKDVNSQGKFVVRMISLSLSEKADPAKYEQTLVILADVHNQRGIKAVEYGIVGEVLFWALRRCLGEQVYTLGVHRAWIKVFSRMLTTMVPVALSYEIHDGSAQVRRTLTAIVALSVAEEDGLIALSDPDPQAAIEVTVE